MEALVFADRIEPLAKGVFLYKERARFHFIDRQLRLQHEQRTIMAAALVFAAEQTECLCVAPVEPCPSALRLAHIKDQ